MLDVLERAVKAKFHQNDSVFGLGTTLWKYMPPRPPL